MKVILVQSVETGSVLMWPFCFLKIQLKEVMPETYCLEINYILITGEKYGGGKILKKSWKQQGLALALTVGLLLTPLSPALAAEDEGLSFDLDQIVVTATKTEKKVRDVPAAVEVITKEEMEKRNIKRVDDALKTIPGVYFDQKKGMMGTTDSITMRGFGSQKQVLIMIDGQPVNDGYSGAVNLANIPTENIERIEVIKGPNSALHGSNALGGVINIITKDKAKQETILRLGIGSQGTKTKSLHNNGSTGKLDYFITAQNTSVAGYESYEEYLNYPVGTARGTNPGKNGMDRELYDAKIIYHIDEQSKLSVTGGKSRFAYFTENIADRGLRDEDSFGIGYDNKLNELSSLKLNYGEQKKDSWYVSTSYSGNNISTYTYNVTPSKTTQTELQYNYQLGAKDLLTVGYAYKTEQADSKKRILTAASGGWDFSKFDANKDENIGGKTETKSLYLQDEHKLNEQTTLYLGGRYDDWRFYDGYTYLYNTTAGKYETKNTAEGKANSFNPKLGLVYKANDKLTIRSSIGNAFRAPNVYELAKDWESNTAIYKCNPDLKPEKTTNYELGLDYQIDKTLLTRVNIYKTDVTDLINKKTTAANAPGNLTGKSIEQFINSGKAEIKGIEISLNKRWDSNWSSFMNYTYTDAKVKESLDASTIGKQISYVPKKMFDLGVNYNKGPWQGSLTGKYVSEANTPAKTGSTGYATYEEYFTVDMKLSHKLTEDTSLSLSIDNLFDKQYYSYYKTPGRATYLELTKKF